MSDNVDVRLLQQQYEKLSTENDSLRRGGQEPPGGGPLEKRVEKLESTIVDVQLRLVRIETRLESMATKADIEGVNTRIEAMGRTMIQWAIGAAVVFAGLAFTAARFIPGG